MMIKIIIAVLITALLVFTISINFTASQNAYTSWSKIKFSERWSGRYEHVAIEGSNKLYILDLYDLADGVEYKVMVLDVGKWAVETVLERRRISAGMGGK